MIYYAEPEDSGVYVCFDDVREYGRFRVAVVRSSGSDRPRQQGKSFFYFLIYSIIATSTALMY
jgi:hypothetical protein